MQRDKKQLKVCAISDIHGRLNINIEKSDVLLISGDISPLSLQHNMMLMEGWITSRFIPWCEYQHVDKVVLIAGNHDFYLQDKSDLFREQIKNTKIVYLQDEEFIYQKDDTTSYKIYGTPWCKPFYNWAFMVDHDELKEKFSFMPNDIDILLTHDCPYGYNDICFNNGNHIGNVPLMEAIKEKQPRYVFTGHLHSAEKTPIKLDKSVIQNVCVLGEDYEITYQPTYVTILER